MSTCAPYIEAGLGNVLRRTGGSVEKRSHASDPNDPDMAWAVQVERVSLTPRVESARVSTTLEKYVPFKPAWFQI